MYYLPTKLDSKTAELLDESRRNSEQQLQEALAKIENERKLVESRDESSTVDDTESNTNGGYNGDNNNNDNNNNDSDNENYIDTEINLDRIDN